MTEGQPGSSLLASGREADVYRFGERRVLRRYKDGSSPAEEVELMRYVAEYGYPVPAVHVIHGIDLIMDRVDGPTMMDAVQAGSVGVTAAAAQLADLHDQLHRLPTPPGVPDTERLVHLDLHPLNVLMSADGPVVIDWRYARFGSVALDVAMTAVILAEGATRPSDQRRDLLRAFLTEFLTRVAGDPRPELDRAIQRRATDFPGAEHLERFERAARFVAETVTSIRTPRASSQ